MENILFCSVGRRGRLLEDCKKSKPDMGILATDNSPYAPGLYFADKAFSAPRIDHKKYIDFVLELCQEEKVSAITTLIDPEIEVLAKHRTIFSQQQTLLLCPSEQSAKICQDKYLMYQYLKSKNIRTVLTYDSLEKFTIGLNAGEISFPVFIKPRKGSGSVGAKKVNTLKELEILFQENSHNYIIQELMVGSDIDVDVYVDCISGKVVSAFSKIKIETRIGGANKTISFKDERLFDFIHAVNAHFEFYGPIDIDLFYRDGEYYLSEVNARFGGAYVHAFGAGVDFFSLIENNIRGIENQSIIGNYENDIVMMMYDNVVIKKKEGLIAERQILPYLITEPY